MVTAAQAGKSENLSTQEHKNFVKKTGKKNWGRQQARRKSSASQRRAENRRTEKWRAPRKAKNWRVENRRNEKSRKNEWRTRWASSRHRPIHLEPNAKPHHNAVREQDKSHLYTVQEPNSNMKNYGKLKVQKKCKRKLLNPIPVKILRYPQGKPMEHQGVKIHTYTTFMQTPLGSPTATQGNPTQPTMGTLRDLQIPKKQETTIPLNNVLIKTMSIEKLYLDKWCNIALIDERLRQLKWFNLP